MRRWVVWTIAVGLCLAVISTWVTAAESGGAAPSGNYEPRELEILKLSGPDAAAQRRALLQRAIFRLPPAAAQQFATSAADLSREMAGQLPSCRFLPSEPSGTSPKFDCVFDGGAVAKVKYGRNPEIHAETAATRLLQLLGYPSDLVVIVPRLRCYGCPRYPFVTMHLRWTLGLPLMTADAATGSYTDFEWVSVEHKFPARPIETDSIEGWSWWELDEAGLPRAEVDALRLAASFLAHWDNKASNQRLVCLDEGPSAGAECSQPLALIQDLGATFGPTKVNLARWQQMPVWHDRQTCTISMRALPFGGSSFPDARISEAGRAQLAARLETITDAQVAQLFTDARFPQFQVGTDDAGDLAAWVDAFRYRARQIVDARCNETGGTST